VGSLCRIRWLTVRNTFNELFLIRHATEVDGPQSAWRMFELTVGSQGAAPRDLFLLPPVLGPTLHSPPIEDVLFLRDEMANMAWAVERVIESASGGPLDRYEAYQSMRRRENPPTPGGTGELVYRLGKSVPDYWIPFLPVEGQSSLRLERSALPTVEAGPVGRVLEPERPLLLNDEEVPREGIRVTRSYQYARWADGSTHLWIGRRKRPGRGEGSSGLRFDVAE
jgi:hypothetical protein